MAEFGDLTADQQAQLKPPFDELEALDQAPDPHRSHSLDAPLRFDETGYQAALRQMTVWAQPPLPAAEKPRGGDW